MPKKPARRVDSRNVQGEDTWVELWPTPYGMISKANKVRSNDDPDAIDNWTRQVIIDCVAGWNWTDRDDKPLPLPSTDPSVIDILDLDEVNFLVQKIAEPGTDPKD
jgi:hypothetical protein